MSAEIQITEIAPRLRIAGVLIFLGLLIEALTLEWNSPMAFLVFLGLGGLLIGLGVVFYLFSLVSPSTPQESVTPLGTDTVGTQIAGN
jgi:hypothetical protein